MSELCVCGHSYDSHAHGGGKCAWADKRGSENPLLWVTCRCWMGYRAERREYVAPADSEGRAASSVEHAPAQLAREELALTPGSPGDVQKGERT